MSILQFETLGVLPILKLFAFFTASSAIRYLLIAGGAYLIFWKWGHLRFAHRRVENRTKQKPQIRAEILRSMVAMTAFGLTGALIVIFNHFGLNRLYFNVSDHGWGYFILSIFLMVVFQDAYFYFTHRLMHLPLLYKKVHAVHHLSVNPSPFAAFSFHPYEAILESGVVFIVSLLFPVHMGAVFIFTVLSLLMNVYGHLGYEIYPENSEIHPLFKWMNTSKAHNRHHQWVNGNYGLYFSYWDRILSTWKESRVSTEKLPSSNFPPAYKSG